MISSNYLVKHKWYRIADVGLTVTLNPHSMKL